MTGSKIDPTVLLLVIVTLHTLGMLAETRGQLTDHPSNLEPVIAVATR